MTRPWVSIIIPTYCSVPLLPALIQTLEAQTLDPELMEVVFVDDGSPDTTYKSLVELCATHPSWTALRIENSGWPSTPRNRGIDIAKGEYVFFLDHDDRLHAQAMAAMTGYARDNDYDVVLGKETMVGPAEPHWNCFKKDTELLPGQMTAEALVVITPHKLYRRGFLDAHGIRFPEDHKRLEDFAFNARVYTAGARVGILSSVPSYDWMIHGGNTHTSSVGMKGYWAAFDNSLAPVLELPAGELRDRMLTKWYRSLFMVRLTHRFGHYATSVRQNLWKRLIARRKFFPSHLDADLPFRERAVAECFRRADPDGVLALWEADKDMCLRVDEVTTVRHGHSIDVEFTGHIGRKGERLAARRSNGRALRELPAELAQSLSPDVLALDDSLAKADVQFQIRNRMSRIDWPVFGSGACTYREDENGGFIQVRGQATIDTRHNVFGERLEPGVWDAFVRVDSLGFGGAVKLKRGHEHRLVSGLIARTGRYIMQHERLSRFVPKDAVAISL